MINQTAEDLIKRKKYLLYKRFETVEVLNRNRFKVRDNTRQVHKVIVDDSMGLHMNGEFIEYLDL